MKHALIALVALTANAAAEPHANRAARDARAALVSARRECRHPARKLDAMVEQVFDVTGFGRRVITGWDQLTDAQRLAFDQLAAEVVGREERARAVRLLCRRGTIEQAWEQGDNLIFIDLRVADEDDDDCVQLMFHADGKRWRFDGEWFCGKSVFFENWKVQLGGGDYDAAIAFLRDLSAT